MAYLSIFCPPLLLQPPLSFILRVILFYVGIGYCKARAYLTAFLVNQHMDEFEILFWRNGLPPIQAQK